ncbi:Paired amphipathic helix protein Sin3a [Homalodisca vitripennis]|nr:Paired amphipathic helix protein Sin3a [Homalodisca vitripennis]
MANVCNVSRSIKEIKTPRTLKLCKAASVELQNGYAAIVCFLIQHSRLANEQRNLKEGDGPGRESAGNKQMTAAEVYSQVAKLFVDHDDLLAEFVRFMPDTSNHQTKQACPCEETSTSNRKPAENEKESSTFNNNMSAVSMGSAPPAKMGLKRSSSMTLDHNSPSTSQDATYHPPANKNKRSKPSRRFSL